MLESFDILRWFAVARRLEQVRDRARLEARQRRLIERLRHRVFPRSRFYAPHRDHAFGDLPVMNKQQWMAAFDDINTVGIRLDEALPAAERAERTRDFAPTLSGVTVGLSTGTSGQRGVFLVSKAEQRRWAGVMLAKLLPERPFAKRRIAFFLRANSRLYESAGGFSPIVFRYFDLQEPWSALRERLNAFAPEVLIAPASALRMLARDKEIGALNVSPERVISIAETLYADDRRAIEAAFPAPLGEVYQATEGALAMTCELGRLHLNESFIHFEFDWIDRASGRCAPIVTDLTRETQPVVRYRLDDILVLGDSPCPCGRVSRTLRAIEGRCDDVCALVRTDGSLVRVFPDFIVRSILGSSAFITDFEAIQRTPGTFTIALCGGDEAQAGVRAALADLATRMEALPPDVTFVRYEVRSGKRRRVLCGESS